jgi:hypothetical protein
VGAQIGFGSSAEVVKFFRLGEVDCCNAATCDALSGSGVIHERLPLAGSEAGEGLHGDDDHGRGTGQPLPSRRSDDLAVALQLGNGHPARLAVVEAAEGARPELLTQAAVEAGARHAVERGRARYRPGRG